MEFWRYKLYFMNSIAAVQIHQPVEINVSMDKSLVRWVAEVASYLWILI